MQLAELATGPNVPAVQLRQAVELVAPALADALPATQPRQALEAPVFGWYVPASHGVQLAEEVPPDDTE